VTTSCNHLIAPHCGCPRQADPTQEPPATAIAEGKDPYPMPSEPGKGRVYILMQEDGTVCKIGKTTNLEIRMRDLGRLSPQPLHLVALLEGYTAVERWFHVHFARQYTGHGEWFRFEGELADTVMEIIGGRTAATLCPEHLRSDGFEVASVPEQPRAEPELSAEEVDAERVAEINSRAAQVEQLRVTIRKKRCTDRLSEFCKDAWHALHPTTRLEWSWHHDALCDHLQWALEGWMRTQSDVTYRQAVRWIIYNIPPGTLKTEILMVFAPAWMWMRWPSWRVLCLSSNPKVALQSAVDSRRVILSSWYQQTFQPTWSLREDQNAKGDFGTTAGGQRLSHGMTAQVVGEHADAILLDDPNDPKSANSKSEREEVCRAWDDAIQNRVTDERFCCASPSSSASTSTTGRATSPGRRVTSGCASSCRWSSTQTTSAAPRCRSTRTVAWSSTPPRSWAPGRTRDRGTARSSTRSASRRRCWRSSARSTVPTATRASTDSAPACARVGS
jgi:hypothetical protein